MKIFTISNPRTDSGGFEDENLKCSICGQLSTVYAGFKSLNGQPIQPFLCKSCLCNAENLINKEILKQCKR